MNDPVFRFILTQVGIAWDRIPELDSHWTEFPASIALGLNQPPNGVIQALIQMKREEPRQFQRLCLLALTAESDGDVSDINSLSDASVAGENGSVV